MWCGYTPRVVRAAWKRQGAFGAPEGPSVYHTKSHVCEAYVESQQVSDALRSWNNLGIPVTQAEVEVTI